MRRDRPTPRDDCYRDAIDRFGQALDRLARAYEADPETRRDLIQDIHFAIWRSFGSYDGRCSQRTWIYRVAHNTATSHITRAFRLRQQQFVTLDELSVEPAVREPAGRRGPRPSSDPGAAVCTHPATRSHRPASHRLVPRGDRGGRDRRDRRHVARRDRHEGAPYQASAGIAVQRKEPLMTGDSWGEDARGIWQSQESAVTRMSIGRDARAGGPVEPGVRRHELDRVRVRGRAPALLRPDADDQRDGAPAGQERRSASSRRSISVSVGLRIASRRDGSTRARRASAHTRRSWNAGGRPTWAPHGPSC